MAITNPEFSIAAKKSDRATEWLTRYVEQARIDGWMTRQHNPALQDLALCLTQAEWVSPTNSDLTPILGQDHAEAPWFATFRARTIQLLTVALQTGVLIITEDSQEDDVLKPTSKDDEHWLGNLLVSAATIDHTTALASMMLSNLLAIEWLLHTKEYRTHESVLRPLIEHWQSLPRTVAPELRPDRIMPSKLFGRWPTGSKADRHFLDLAALAEQTALRSTVPEGQLVLPAIDLPPQDRAIVPTALLTLYDALAPTGSGNGAAPIALRLFVEAVQALPLEDRGDGSTARLQLPLEHLRWRLWPNPNSHISIERLRSDLFDALDVLDRLWLPWQDPETGKGGDWRVVLGRNIGRSWDGDLILDIALPPGSRNGPICCPRTCTSSAAGRDCNIGSC